VAAAHRTGVTFFRHRKSKGIPTGGQFAATLQGEPTIHLTPAAGRAGLGHQDAPDMRRAALGMFRDAVQSARRRAEDRRNSPRPKRNLTAMKGAAAVLVLASAVTVSSCSAPYSGDAVVDGKTHTAARTTTTTASNGKYSWPVTKRVPEAWRVKLHGAGGQTIDVKVNQAQYDQIEQGETLRIDNGQLPD
jgi:hypothetical protein